jgi:hypothetical protein
MYDENKNVIMLDHAFPSKYAVAIDEIKTCLGCLDTVGKCAWGLEVNLTNVQAEHSMATLNGLIEQLNKLKEQNDRERAEILELRTSAPMWYKRGYIIMSALVGAITYILGGVVPIF